MTRIVCEKKSGLQSCCEWINFKEKVKKVDNIAGKKLCSVSFHVLYT